MLLDCPFKLYYLYDAKIEKFALGVKNTCLEHNHLAAFDLHLKYINDEALEYIKEEFKDKNTVTNELVDTVFRKCGR